MTSQGLIFYFFTFTCFIVAVSIFAMIYSNNPNKNSRKSGKNKKRHPSGSWLKQTQDDVYFSKDSGIRLRPKMSNED